MAKGVLGMSNVFLVPRPNGVRLCAVVVIGVIWNRGCNPGRSDHHGPGPG